MTPPFAHLIEIQFLFTVGMTFVDSSDSILMLYTYASFPERSLKLFERVPEPESEKSSLKESENPASGPRNSLSVQSPVDVESLTWTRKGIIAWRGCTDKRG